MEAINWDELKEKYKDSLDVVKGYETALKNIDLLKDLHNHAGIQILVQNYKNEIDYINKELTYDRYMSPEKRSELFITRDKAEMLVSIFEGLDAQQKQVEIAVNDLQEGK